MPFLNTRGARISYARAGAGPVVLFIQGAGVIGDGWTPQTEGLSGEYTVIAFDNRGIGKSTIADGGRVTIEDMARDALAIVDAEGVDRFHVVGHSMGGLIAQALALRARERVRSLALLCTFVRGSEGARLSAAMMLTALRMRIGTPRMRRRAFLDLVMPAAYLETVDDVQLAANLAPLFGHDLADQPWFVLRQVRAMARYEAAARWPELAGIPTLVASAAHDRIALPRYGRALASLIPNARYVEYPDAGHAVTIQCADRVTARLREHFAGVEARVVTS
jgi:pimeloyl-ACP methyl ester carboxylesterase